MEESCFISDNSERSTYPLIPKFDRNIVTFFTGMMDYLDELVNFFPLCKVGLIDATKAEVSTDFKKVSAGILLDSSMFRDDACESAKKRKSSENYLYIMTFKWMVITPFIISRIPTVVYDLQ